VAKGPLPQCSEFFAGIMFLDVSGFTAITELASARGHYGVELITNVLNRYFNELNKLLFRYGGEIVKFGGDACLALFPSDSEENLSDLEELRNLILKLCQKLHKEFKQAYGIKFAIHGAIGKGMVNVHIVGDRQYHLDYYVCSEAIQKVYELAERAKAGEILGSIHAEVDEDLYSNLPVFTPRLAYLSTRFLPPAVRLKLSQDSNPAELRNVAVIFLKLSPRSGDEIAPQDYHDYYRRVQGLVYNHHGVINKIDYNEKGYLILAVFGAPFVSANDIESAFITAFHIAALSSNTIKVQIGITYSNIYCGIIGSSRRWEYGIIGNAVNIAARMMSFAQPGDICLTREILPRLQGIFETQFVASTSVKGISGEIEIHKLVRELPQRWAQYEKLFQQAKLVVLHRELERLHQDVAAAEALLCTVRGGKGCGKSYLLWQISTQLMQDGLPFNFISANPFGKNLRLEIFFSTMRNHLGITHFREQFFQIVRWCEEQGIRFEADLVRRNLFSSSEKTTENIKQEIELVSGIFYEILAHIYTKDKVLIIDNLDRFDPESQKLLQRLIKKILYDKGKVIISTQQDPPRFDCAYNSQELELVNFDLKLTQQFVNLFIPNISRAAIASLHALSEGNPRFLFELVQHIVAYFGASQDLITDQIIAQMRHQGLLPDSLENLLLANYEKLEPAAKNLLKYASIFGRAFNPEELAGIFGIGTAGWFQTSLETLRQQGFLQLNQLEPVPMYEVANQLLMESIYRSILLSEKLQYHKSIARYYEKSYTPGDLALADLVAHHYLQAQEKANICRWFGLLAEHYRSSGALELSLRFYQIIADNSMDELCRDEANLNSADLMLQLADNDAAKVILDGYSRLLQETSILHDRYVHLQTRYFINTAGYNELRQFVPEYLDSIQDSDLRNLLQIDYMEALLFSKDIETFQRLAFDLYEQLSQEENPHYQSLLAAVIGTFYSNQGDYAKAAEYYQDKLQICRKLHDPIGMRIALSGLGNSLNRRGQKRKALKYYQLALQIAELSGDRNGYSKALLNIGTIHRNYQEYEAAIECYQKSLLIADLIGNIIQKSIILYNIGEVHSYLQQWDQALELFYQSLAISKEISDYSGISFCNDAIGDMNYRLNKFSEAKQIYQDNLRLQYQINDREGMAHTFGNLGNLARVEKKFANARKLYHLQVKILSEIGDQDGCGRAWFNLAMVDKEENDPAAAKAKLKTALQLFQNCSAEYYIQITQEQLKLLEEG